LPFEEIQFWGSLMALTRRSLVTDRAKLPSSIGAMAGGGAGWARAGRISTAWATLVRAAIRHVLRRGIEFEFMIPPYNRSGAETYIGAPKRRGPQPISGQQWENQSVS